MRIFCASKRLRAQELRNWLSTTSLDICLHDLALHRARAPYCKTRMAFHPAARNWDGPCKWTAGAIFVAAAAGVFLAPPDLLFGSAQADLGQQFLAWRAFAADSLRAGHLPFWNPYTYSGEPFLGGFQSALFYPLNLIYLVLPVCRAVNLSFLLHLFILGCGMYRWAVRRGLHPLAAGLCGVVLSLSGPVFPHIYAGHLSNLCALAWTPWILSELDDWQRTGSRRSLLYGSASVCLQILAGHPQYAFCTALAAALQTAASAISKPRHWRRAVFGAAGMFAGAAALAAAQLVPGFAAASENVRNGGLATGFAGQFSFPPENLLTAIAPGFFGDLVHSPYWGRCYPWEMFLFVGASGIFLFGVALRDPEHRRSARFGAGIAFVLLLLALGRHTPLLQVLSDTVPGFDWFRGPSKFTFPAAVFAAAAIGCGADALLKGRFPARAFLISSLVAGAATVAAGLFLARDPAAIEPFISAVRDSGESYLPAAALADPAAVREAGWQAARSLILAGGVLLLAGASLLSARRRPILRWVVLCLPVVEMTGFAAGQFATFRRSDAVSPELRSFVAAHPGDYRVQNLLGPDNGYLTGAPDIWGNDPGLLKRYAEFIAFTQGIDPDPAGQNVEFRSLSPLYSILRLRYIFTRTAEGFHSYEIPGAMERVQLVSDCRVAPRRDELFLAMSRPDFDPRKTVMLESEPLPHPTPALSSGTVRVLSATPDELTVEADVQSPSLLLVTDGYSRDWRARPLPGSSQNRYEVMPADYVLRATPLAAGHHTIAFEFEPEGLRAGAAVSLLAWAAWIALCVSLPSAKREQPAAVPTPDKP